MKRYEGLEADSTKFFISLLGSCVNLLGVASRKIHFQVLLTLMERCAHTAVPRERVRILELWPYESTRYELALTERAKLLLKITLFERISGTGSQELRSYDALERPEDASNAFMTALGAAQGSGSAWLHYGTQRDKISASRMIHPLLWREAAANCYIQAIQFG